MASLQNFPNISRGNISLCEKNGQICSLPIAEIDISELTSRLPELIDYPDVNIGRELFHSASTLHDIGRSMVVTVREPSIKKLARIFVEEGLLSAINEAANPTENQEINPLIRKIAQSILKVSTFINEAKYLLFPHLKEQDFISVAQFSETREWSRSPIRYIKWHPNCFKIAVAASDDSIRVYMEDGTIVPILKSGLQKNISSLAWRPFSATELAVGCQNGVLIWTIDPNSHITRPLSQALHLKFYHNAPVSSIEWSPNGRLLAACSLSNSDILIWDVDQDSSIPLKRVGFSSSLLKWSPDGMKLCCTTVGNIFRVWDTSSWIPERWSLASGAIQSVVWSENASHLLFVTTNEPYLFCMCFAQENLFQKTTIFKEALPIADLSKTTINNSVEVGGKPQALTWCPSNHYLAIIFKDTSAIAIFSTSISNNQLSITPSCLLMGIGAEYPSFITFQNKYRKNDHIDSILTIGWSSGRIQYFPFV